ncbi:hypothetical protein BaRGS_00015543 [Batillaria attramentaria]|uniref:EGF-like domain-containing protein n=1 Tax=Batillaria attramentaria TaxID=370345 RepID=A0ABD0L1S5_9CAEN
MARLVKRFQTCLVLFLCFLHFETRTFGQAYMTRHFLHSVCIGKALTSDIIKVERVRSLLECVKECATLGECRSVSVCKEDGKNICSLSTGTLSSCNSLAVQGNCSFIQMMDPCENDGVLDKATMTCNCPVGWEGKRCETPSPETTTEASTTTVDPYSCLSGQACDGASAKSYSNGVAYCCPSGSSSVSVRSINGVVTCSCS